MVGESSDGKQLTLSRDSGLDTSKPKHGKVLYYRHFGNPVL